MLKCAMLNTMSGDGSVFILHYVNASRIYLLNILYSLTCEVYPVFYSSRKIAYEIFRLIADFSIFP